MLNKNELDRIVDAIRIAEDHTSAEIRVCIVKKCKETPLDAAYKKFKQLKMDKTALRNSVLIYVAPNDHKTAIIGDSGIDLIADRNFWDSALSLMITYFKKGEICEGICKGVNKVGELIKTYYPISDDDFDELSNEVVLDDE